MRKNLRAVVESIVKEALADDEQEEGYEDLNAYCGHCAQKVYLVWDKKHPEERWTECGIESGVHSKHDEDEPAPPTLRSPFNPNASTKVKRSV